MILRRRKWPIIILPILVAMASYIISSREQPLYQGDAQVLVDTSSIVSAISGVQDPAVGDPTRFLTTEASIARSPVLAARVVAAARVPGLTSLQLLDDSSVTAEADADILDVAVSSPNSARAVLLTNTYAQEFTRYKTELDTQKINTALSSLRTRIKALHSTAQPPSIAYTTLLQYQSQLETIETLLANDTTVLRPAPGATKLRPRPLHTAILGFLLGGAIGLVLALLLEGLDRRVRSELEIQQVLRLPLLGRIPQLPPHLQRASALLAVSAPESVHAESFRKLRTTLDLLDLDRGTQRIMITSAVPGEGKSTTVANLAVALAQSGRRVALVDLDLRRPFLHSFFSTGVERGVTDVVVGGVKLADALRPIVLPDLLELRPLEPKPPVSRRTKTDVPVFTARRVLSFLPAGSASTGGHNTISGFPKNEELDVLLEELAEQFDFVLVDAPPLLTVNDAMALTTKVDAIILVLKAGIQRPVLVELARQLESSRAPALGFVLTGVAETETFAYGYQTYVNSASAAASSSVPGAEPAEYSRPTSSD